MIDRLSFGFCPACGDEYADADMAVSLQATGGHVVFEHTSKIIAAQERHRPQPAFKAGLYGERLFWSPLPQNHYHKVWYSMPLKFFVTPSYEPHSEQFHCWLAGWLLSFNSNAFLAVP